MSILTNRMFYQGYYADGEGLDHNDLRDQNTYARRFMSEALLMNMQRVATTSNTDFDRHVWALGASALPSYVPGGRNFTAGGGLIGCEPTTGETVFTEGLVPFYIDPAAPLTVTIADGHATLPRVDSVCIRIKSQNNTATREFKDAGTNVITSQVGTLYSYESVLEYQVVQGTPAASPLHAASPAGYARLFSVVVAPGSTGAFAASANAGQALMLDWRVPLGNRSSSTVSFYNSGFHPPLRYTSSTASTSVSPAPFAGSGGEWSADQTNGCYAANGSGSTLYAIPKNVPYYKRLAQVRISGLLTGAATIHLGIASNTTFSTSSILQLSNGLSTDSVNTFNYTGEGSCEVPIWGSGYYTTKMPAINNDMKAIGIRIVSGNAGDRVRHVEFDWVG